MASGGGCGRSCRPGCTHISGEQHMPMPQQATTTFTVPDMQAPMKPSPSLIYNNLTFAAGSLLYAHLRQVRRGLCVSGICCLSACAGASGGCPRARASRPPVSQPPAQACTLAVSSVSGSSSPVPVRKVRAPPLPAFRGCGCRRTPATPHDAVLPFATCAVHNVQVESQHTDVIYTIRACSHNSTTYVIVATEVGVQVNAVLGREAGDKGEAGKAGMSGSGHRLA